MIHAYNELYLDKAQVSLGTMLDFAVNTIHYKIGTFMDLFIGSGNATLFESGNPETLVGRLGIELVYDTLEKSNLNFNIVDYSPVYEQRQKNINKAQVDYLIRLSSALNCEITALIEKI